MKDIEELVIKFKNDYQDDTFKEIYQILSPILYRYLLRNLRNKELADEFLQEIFLKMIDKVKFYSSKNEGGGGFKQWMFRMATNMVIDHHRKNKTKDKVSEILVQNETLPHGNLDDDYIKKEEKNSFMNIFDKLPHIDKIFLSLRINEDFSYFEISKICGISENAVKQRFFRAKKNIAKLITLKQQEGL